MKAEKLVFGAGIECVIPAKMLRHGTKLYMAGPLGFAQSTRPFHEQMNNLVIAMGGEVLDPWVLTPFDLITPVLQMPPGQEQIDAWNGLNKIIAGNNLNAVRECSGIVANLDGTDVDSGTAAEIGAAFVLGKPIVGYRGDFRLARDNAGGVVNLQVEYFIRESAGGQGGIVTAVADLPRELLRVWGE